MGDGVVMMPRQGGPMVGGREAWGEARGETLISSAGEEFEMQINMKGRDEDVEKLEAAMGEVLAG